MNYWDVDSCEEDLRDFTILIRLFDGGQTEHRFTIAWTAAYDGTWCRIALPFAPVVANLHGPSEFVKGPNDNVGSQQRELTVCSGLWKVLAAPMDVGFLPSKLHELVVEMAVYHQKLGYAKLGSFNMQGADNEALHGDLRGRLQPDAENPHDLWRSADVRGAIADGETLCFRKWAMEEKFGDNPDVRSAATAVDACICGTYQDCELEMVARWRGSRWEVAVHAVRWRLLEHQEAKDEEEQRQWYARLKEQNVSLPAVLASQLSWFPD